MEENDKIRQLQQKIALVEAQRQALREFLIEARSHEDMFSWIANLELRGQYPGKDLGLTVTFDGAVSFRETDD